MRNTTLKQLLSVACIAVCTTGQAQKNFYHYSEVDKNVKATSMSPNGKFIVGIDYVSKPYANTFMTGFSSFVWNTEKDTKEWLTTADQEQLDKTGYFYDVNDAGTIVGCYKDKQNKITTSLDGVEATAPVSTAAVWTNGKVKSLGLGTDFKLEQCKHFTDGTIATAISNDSKTIGGNYVMNDVAYPCVWKLDDKGNWVYQALTLTEKNGITATKGSVTDVSADGSVIVGNVYDEATYSYIPAYWTNNELHVIFAKHEDHDLTGRNSVGSAMAVSANGEYISLKYKKKFLAVYSMTKQSYVRVEQVAGAGSLEYAPVADNGNVMPTFVCGRIMAGGVYYRPMWYSYADNSLVDLSYFLSIYASNVEFPFPVELEDKPTVYISTMSADGLTIMGNNEQPDPENQMNKICSAWVMKASMDNVKVPEVPQMTSAKLTGMNQVTVVWSGVEDKNYKLKGYRIYQNGNPVADVALSNTSQQYEYVIGKSQRGYVSCAVSALYEQPNGKTLESPKSAGLTVAVPYSDAKSLFEDFEKDKWKKNLWSFTKEVANEEIADSWGCLEYHGLESSSAGLTVAHRTTRPYSLSAVSRPVNATKAVGNVHFAMAVRQRIYENNNADLTKDSLSLDVSTDWGNTWEEAAAWTVADFGKDFSFESVDITQQTAGKIFQIRLRSHGQAAAPVQFIIDHLSVQEENAYAPTDLMTINMKDGKSRMLRWKNNYGAYELNYICSPFNCYGGKTIGNNGKEIIGANLYDQEMLKPFDGKYLTTVTTSMNWYKDGNRQKMDATIMVWEDGVLVREQAVPVKTFNKYFVVPLEEPLQIDATKSLKIGVKVYNYPESQMPLLYFATDEYVNGKSDLYSEDGGKTWSTLKEAFANSEHPEDGYGVWRISAGISDESTTAFNPKDRTPLFVFNVYRDGQRLNENMIHYLQGRYLEKDIPATGTYSVRGFYEKGGVSALSKSYTFVPTGIDNAQSQPGIFYHSSTKTLSLGDGNVKVTLYTTDGKKVAETNQPQMQLNHLPAGMYIVKIEGNGITKGYKLLVE